MYSYDQRFSPGKPTSDRFQIFEILMGRELHVEPDHGHVVKVGRLCGFCGMGVAHGSSGWSTAVVLKPQQMCKAPWNFSDVYFRPCLEKFRFIRFRTTLKNLNFKQGIFVKINTIFFKICFPITSEKMSIIENGIILK